MLLAYTYKVNPSLSQAAIMSHWLHLLRLQFNFRLRERIEAYEMTRRCGPYCDLKTKAEITPLACSVSKGALYGEAWKWDKEGKAKRRSPFEQQCADLVNLKQERPWYKEVNANVQQQMLRQLDAAFQNFFKHGRGYPKLKRKYKFQSFTYPPRDVQFKGNRVRLPGIGRSVCGGSFPKRVWRGKLPPPTPRRRTSFWMTFFQSRLFPDGFEIKSVTVRHKAGSWYISVRLQDDSVPAHTTPNQVKTAVGVDLGIKKLMALSDGELITNPRFYKQVERRRRILGRRASHKVLGSKNRAKAYQRLARLENLVARRREDYQWKKAHELVSCFDCIIFEDLNVRGMMARCKPKQDETGRFLKNGQTAKSGLNQSLADASWSSLKQKVLVLSSRAGALVHEVTPRFTSLECSACGFVSKTNRDKEKFVCEACGHHADADIDAAVVIRRRGLEELGIKLPQLPVVHRKVTAKERSARDGTSPTISG